MKQLDFTQCRVGTRPFSANPIALCPKCERPAERSQGYDQIDGRRTKVFAYSHKAEWTPAGNLRVTERCVVPYSEVRRG